MMDTSQRQGWAKTAIAAGARFADGILATVEGWRARYSLRRELDRLRRSGELERTLADNGIAMCDLPRLLHANPRTREQFAQMMSRLGVNRAKLPASSLETVREMEWRCSDCAAWRRCGDWLKTDESPQSAPDFCPNAAAFDQLRGAGAARQET